MDRPARPRLTRLPTALTFGLASLLFVLAQVGCGARSAEAPATGPPDEAQVEPATPEAAAAVDPSQGAAAEPPRSGFRPPRVLTESRFMLADARQIEGAPGDFILRYRGPERPTVDVFLTPVYPPGSEPPDSVLEPLLERRFEGEIEGIRRYAEAQGWGFDLTSEVEVLAVETHYGTRQALQQRMRYIRDDQGRADSHLILLMIEGSLVKLRTTFDEDRREEGEPHLRAFLLELVQHLEFGMAPEPGAGNPPRPGPVPT